MNGVVRAFLAPVYMALFARVLKREEFARGAGIGSVVMQTGLVLGPALGGVLVAWGGKTSAYLVAAGFAAAAAIAIIALRVTEPPAPTERAPVFKSIGEGLRFVFNHQILLGALTLDMFSVLFGGAVALLPAFITEVLRHGPEALGVLRAAPAAGAVLVGVWLAHRPPQRHAGRLLLLAVAGFGLCIIGFAVAIVLGVGGDADAVGHVRRRVGGGALDHPAIGHARRHARPARRSTAFSSARPTNWGRSSPGWPRACSDWCRRSSSAAA